MRLLSMDQSLDVLHTDRLQLLEKNKKELCQKIDIETDLLDILVKQGVITAKDKQQIVVGIFFRLFLLRHFVHQGAILHRLLHHNQYNLVYTMFL